MDSENINLNEESRASQSAKILAHLQGGGRITSLEALRMFGCLRLASRIANLRRENDIRSRFVTLPNGKRVKEYFIEELCSYGKTL